MEAVILIGIQASGKTTFYRQRFFDTHLRLSLDMLRTRHRESLLVAACLAARQPFVVDNTNPTPAERQRYLLPARRAGFRTVGYCFLPDPAAARQRNDARPPDRRIPPAGLFGTLKRLAFPTPDEGFDQLFDVTPGIPGPPGSDFTFHITPRPADF